MDEGRGVRDASSASVSVRAKRASRGLRRCCAEVGVEVVRASETSAVRRERAVGE
ncbi:hypothetical protein [Halococcus sp. AFM35]|uniref:hypothetical protein n=1 Tax=Halococcus sp. AFM35 TaxID=3421653 RepID=UPI003EB6C0D4